MSFNLLQMIAKPFLKKAKEDLSIRVKAFIDERKQADEDNNGETDYQQILSDGTAFVGGLKQAFDAAARIAALLGVYYLKYSPQKRAQVVALIQEHKESELA